MVTNYLELFAIGNIKYDQMTANKLNIEFIIEILPWILVANFYIYKTMCTALIKQYKNVKII